LLHSVVFTVVDSSICDLHEDNYKLLASGTAIL